jgi:hypothetical protein
MFVFIASNIADFQVSACVASRAKSLNISMLSAFQGGQNSLLEETETSRLEGHAFKSTCRVYSPGPEKCTSWARGFFRS